MLSHDNLTWSGRSVERFFPDRRETDSIVSYLPLSHVAAQVTTKHTETERRRRAVSDFVCCVVVCVVLDCGHVSAHRVWGVCLLRSA
jgi:long-subunit acyl-CoA synthetase (AMP-forming)